MSGCTCRARGRIRGLFCKSDIFKILEIRIKPRLEEDIFFQQLSIDINIDYLVNKIEAYSIVRLFNEYIVRELNKRKLILSAKLEYNFKYFNNETYVNIRCMVKLDKFKAIKGIISYLRRVLFIIIKQGIVCIRKIVSLRRVINKEEVGDFFNRKIELMEMRREGSCDLIRMCFSSCEVEFDRDTIFVSGDMFYFTGVVVLGYAYLKYCKDIFFDIEFYIKSKLWLPEKSSRLSIVSVSNQESGIVIKFKVTEEMRRGINKSFMEFVVRDIEEDIYRVLSNYFRKKSNLNMVKFFYWIITNYRFFDRVIPIVTKVPYFDNIRTTMIFDRVAYKNKNFYLVVSINIFGREVPDNILLGYRNFLVSELRAEGQDIVDYGRYYVKYLIDSSKFVSLIDVISFCRGVLQSFANKFVNSNAGVLNWIYGNKNDLCAVYFA